MAKLDPCVLHTWHIVHSGCLIQTLCLFCACVQEIPKKDEGSSANYQTWLSIKEQMYIHSCSWCSGKRGEGAEKHTASYLSSLEDRSEREGCVHVCVELQHIFVFVMIYMSACVCVCVCPLSFTVTCSRHLLRNPC